jgi:hypothetical protein
VVSARAVVPCGSDRRLSARCGWICSLKSCCLVLPTLYLYNSSFPFVQIYAHPLNRLTVPALLRGSGGGSLGARHLSLAPAARRRLLHGRRGLLEQRAGALALCGGLARVLQRQRRAPRLSRSSRSFPALSCAMALCAAASATPCASPCASATPCASPCALAYASRRAARSATSRRARSRSDVASAFRPARSASSSRACTLAAPVLRPAASRRMAAASSSALGGVCGARGVGSLGAVKEGVERCGAGLCAVGHQRGVALAQLLDVLLNGQDQRSLGGAGSLRDEVVDGHALANAGAIHCGRIRWEGVDGKRGSNCRPPTAPPGAAASHHCPQYPHCLDLVQQHPRAAAQNEVALH